MPLHPDKANVKDKSTPLIIFHCAHCMKSVRADVASCPKHKVTNMNKLILETRSLCLFSPRAAHQQFLVNVDYM